MVVTRQECQRVFGPLLKPLDAITEGAVASWTKRLEAKGYTVTREETRTRLVLRAVRVEAAT